MKKCQRLILLLLGSLILTGCSMQEEPRNLTEEEQQLIVSYSAHIVSKYNNYQKDGLTYTAEMEETGGPDGSETPADTGQPENDGMTEGGAADTPETEAPGEVVTFESAYADSGLTFTYQGNEITASYMEDDTYAVNASFGKTLLVLKVNVANQTEEAVTVDNMSDGDTFSANFTTDTGIVYNAKAVLTLLLNDFTTYEGTIEPQTAVDMVLVFEIPEETAAVEGLVLKISRGEQVFQINL